MTQAHDWLVSRLNQPIIRKPDKKTADENAEVTRIADEIQRRYAQGGAVHYDEDLVNRIADEVMEQLYG